jgi:murein DD-endopeptidase MepM/ murein hydrolase activator NlpD
VSDEKQGPPRLTVILVPERSQETRTYHLSYRSLRMFGALAAVLALALTLVAGSWWYLAARASRVGELENQVAELMAERQRVQELGQQLESIEAQYGRIRDLFGIRSDDTLSQVWLPPPAGTPRGAGTRSAALSTRPTSWPLTERGFVTQGLLEGDRVEGDHPGLDIAVPTDSYVRASGAGTVREVGEDEVYGSFVVIDHGEGYTSLYGHASSTLVSLGQRVRQNEVIALSGSTGRSTAPHLHFEILLDGEAVDPLTMVQQP